MRFGVQVWLKTSFIIVEARLKKIITLMSVLYDDVEVDK